SEPMHFAAMEALLKPLGHEVTGEHQFAVMARSIPDTWAYLRDTFGLEGPAEELVDAYGENLMQRLRQMRETLPGVRELVSALKERDVPMAVASSSLPDWIEALLEGVGLSDAFDALVSASMVEHPKPAPDIYLEAARRLATPPERCIAIEDTPTGLKAAKAAGMHVVQVRSSTAAWPPQPEADVVLDSLEDFDLAWVSGNATDGA